MAKISLFKTKEPSRIDKLIGYAKTQQYEDNSTIIDFLKRCKDEDLLITFKKVDILYETVYRIISKKLTGKSLGFAKNLFDSIVFDPDNKDEVVLYYKFLDKFLSNSVYLDYMETHIDSFDRVYNIFRDKMLAFSFFNYFCDYVISSKADADMVIEYAIDSRPYYVDESAYYASLMLFTNQSLDVHGQDLESLYEDSLNKDKRCAGIYDIDEDKIYDLSKRVVKAEKGLLFYERRAKELDDSIEGMSATIDKKVHDYVEKEVKGVEHRLGEVKKDTNALFETSKQSCNNVSKKLSETLDKVHEETGAVRSEMVSILDGSKVEAEAQIARVEAKGQEYLTAMDERIGVHPELKTMRSESTSNSPYFDSNVPYKQRYSKAISHKSQDELYHESFDKILKQVILNKPVMIVGPSGGGKTYTVSQLGAVLGTRVYNFGFVSDEYATIKGYNDANGRFVQTPFYEIYKNGGIAFFDEIDNSESKALIELNKIMGGSKYEPYLFPNGEIITPHPDFRLIAAGNTWGDGADPLYPTREKIDRATMNRFAAIYYGYDEVLEERILKDYKDAFVFCLAFRKALIAKQYDDVLSTRDLADIKTYLDTGSFSIDEIIEIKFIKNKRIDTLKSISELMSKLSSSNPFYVAFIKAIKDQGRVLRR